MTPPLRVEVNCNTIYEQNTTRETIETSERFRKETTQYKLSPWIKPGEMKKELYMKDSSNLIYVQNSDNVSGDVNDNLLLL